MPLGPNQKIIYIIAQLRWKSEPFASQNGLNKPILLWTNQGADENDGTFKWDGVENIDSAITSEVCANFTYGATLGIAAKSEASIALSSSKDSGLSRRPYGRHLPHRRQLPLPGAGALSYPPYRPLRKLMPHPRPHHRSVYGHKAPRSAIVTIAPIALRLDSINAACALYAACMCILLNFSSAAAFLSGVAGRCSPQLSSPASPGLRPCRRGTVLFVSFGRPKFRARLLTINGGRRSHSDRSFLFRFDRPIKSTHFLSACVFSGRAAAPVPFGYRLSAQRAVLSCQVAQPAGRLEILPTIPL